MNITRLEATYFRNLAAARIEPGEGVNVFFGDNGAGKTNLLEAVFVLCLARSQRGARDVMMVGEGETDFFRLEGNAHLTENGGDVHLTVAYQKNGRKKVTIDGNPAGPSRLFQTSVVISMAPEDVALFAGSPSVRRHFLDLYISQASPAYLADLNDYAKALAQKNAFLKNSPSQFCPFDPILVQSGVRIMAARDRFIRFLQAQAPDYYRKISGRFGDDGQPEFGIVYRPNVPFETEAQLPSAFQTRLEAMRKKEEILQTALVGPHRDDIDFSIGGFPARGYGSQGELRSGAVAVMMATAGFLEERRREKPILLLDEIFAELDDHRRENLAGLFGRLDQIFLTTAVTPPQSLAERARVFQIRNGNVLSE